MMGLVVSFFASRLTLDSERELTNEEEGNLIAQNNQNLSTVHNITGYVEGDRSRQPEEGFKENFKRSMKAICQALRLREIYQLVLFFILHATFNPRFDEFSYFFLLNVIQISKFTLAFLVLVSQVSHIVGATIYQKFFKDVETRKMALFAFISSSFFSFLNFTFAKRWNLQVGIPDMTFLLFTDVVFNVIVMFLIVLPLMALFAKVTPKEIEGTIYAFLTGTMNMGNTVIATGLGSLINSQFVGVNKNDLSNYSTLCLISFIGTLFNFLLLLLIPTSQNIKQWQASRVKESEMQ